MSSARDGTSHFAHDDRTDSPTFLLTSGPLLLFWQRTGEIQAVKMFHPAPNQSRALQLQLREFEVLSKLNHDNIVKMLAVEDEVMIPSSQNCTQNYTLCRG